MYTYMCVHKYVSINVHLYIYVYTYMCVIYTHIYMFLVLCITGSSLCVWNTCLEPKFMVRGHFLWYIGTFIQTEILFLIFST